MAFGYDGSVRIKADLDHRAFDRGLTSMTGQVNKFSKTLTNIAKTVAVAFGTAALVNFGREAVKAASALNDAWMGLQSIVEGQGRSFSKAKSFIDGYISDGLVPLQNAVTAYKNLAARGYSTEQIEQTLTALKDAAAFGRQASYSLGEAVTSATEGLKNENSILVDNAGVTKNVAKMWDEYARSIGTTANRLTQTQKIQAEVNGILRETRFQTGDAAKLTTTYSGQIAMLGYNFQNLKVQVGNALIPIAQAVLPGINAIIAGLTKLARVFAQVTALLFGKPTTGVSTQVSTNEQVTSSSLAAADATDKLAESTAGAGSASKKTAKEMKGVLASFDELNILADSAADSMYSAAGAAGGIDVGDIDTSTGEIWEDAKINPDLSADVYALTQKLKDMIPLIAGIGAGLAAWKIASSLIPDLGLLKTLLGSLLVGVGVTLLVDSIKDIIFGDGLTWKNILEGAAGGAIAGAGLGLMLAKKLGLTWAKGMLGGAIIGLGVALSIEAIADILVRGLNIKNGILGAIGGAIAGAAAGYLYMGGPGGAILGATIGVGVSLVLEAISDIIKVGLNLTNGAVGLIGGALAGAGLGFYLGGPGGAALGAVIGVGLTLTLEGVVSQIAAGVDIFKAIATVVGTALAGAGIGFTVGGGVGAAAGAIIGITAGVVIELTGIKAAGEAAYAATEDFKTMSRVLDECEDSANRSSAAMETLEDNIENLNTSLADVGAAQSLVEEIYAINENANASAYELELMATKVELLNSMGLEGLHLTIDETTGRIVETKEATDNLILSLQKEAETAALQQLLVQAYKDRYQAVVDAEQAVKNITVAEQALAKTEQELTNTPWWDLEKHAALTAQQEKQTEALEAATESRNKAITAYDELSGAIDNYSGALTNLKEPESGVGVVLEERMGSVRKTVEGVAEDMPGYGRDIGEGLEKGMDEGVNEEKTKSIFSRIGDWFKNLFGISSPSKVFAEFGKFLMDGLHNGMDDNLSPIQELFKGLWGDIKKGAEDSWGGTKSAWDPADTWFNSNVVEPVGKFFSDLWDDINKDGGSAWDDIQSAWRGASSWFEENVTKPIGDFFRNLWQDIRAKWADITSGPSGGAGRYTSSNGMHYGPRMVQETYSARSIPKLANGAVIPPNQQFAAILGDQRSGVNVEAPLSTIRQAVTEAIQASGGLTGNNGNVTVIMEIDGREFGRASYKYGSAERQRVGVRLTEVRT